MLGRCCVSLLQECDWKMLQMSILSSVENLVAPMEIRVAELLLGVVEKVAVRVRSMVVVICLDECFHSHVHILAIHDDVAAVGEANHLE